MPNPGEILTVDLESTRLFGWEKRKSDKVIDALIKAIERGADIPPVRVYAERDDLFLAASIHPSNEGSLSPDGGHHRAIAHYIAGAPLPVKILQGENCVRYTPIPINDIEIVDDNGELAAKQRRDPNYR